MKLQPDCQGIERGAAFLDEQAARMGVSGAVVPLSRQGKGNGLPAEKNAAEGNSDNFAESIKKDGESNSGDSATCPYGGGRFEVSERGVFFIGTDKDGNEQSPLWICSPLYVVAKTRNGKSDDWGRLLEWRDDDGTRHQWAMPLEILRGTGEEARGELMRQGLSVSPNRAARDLLASYLQTWPTNRRARCVDCIGWHGDIFVMPDGVIGQADELAVFQNAHAVTPAFSERGTLADWRESVASRAAGNSRLVFAISVAFAAALAEPAGEDSGGFHLRGGSSTGKSTALALAASVWGEPAKYARLWRATANGLEGLAALHNDGLLILDEIAQIDARQAGEAAYMLANGQGKTRASRIGTARAAARWRLLFLSAGEISLSGLMMEAGKRARAGQEIRLADIPIDAGRGMGAFENIHDAETPAAFALHLKEAATANHGTAGMAWLREVVESRAGLSQAIAGAVESFCAANVPKGAGGQVERVARRFALAGIAGELARKITGWPEGEAMAAAQACFSAWLDSFGGAGNSEARAILAQVKAFFEAHGASRFESVASDKAEKIINRAGFYRTGEDSRPEYLVLPEAFKNEVCKGLDPRQAAATLRDAGWLAVNDGRNATQKVTIPGLGRVRCYVITGRMWEGNDDA
jgi:uncharacterized protein (DUF927 family)